MARSHQKLACLVLFAAALVGSTAARSLSQFQSQAFCPDGCTDTGCVQDATKGGLRCQKCSGNLVVNLVTGNCACPAGKWASGRDTCTDCPKGSFCPGSDYYVPGNTLSPIFPQLAYAPLAQQCPISGGANMTTLGRRATSNRACVNLPGYSYTIDALGTTVGQAICPVNTYSAGLKKQRACVPCPTGYTTNGATGSSTPTACVVPAGYYLKAPGQIAPCPKGEWKSGIGSNGNCTKCAFGVTTAAEGSTTIDACTIVVAGYYPLRVENGIVTATVACPQGYYCPGGNATAAFNPAVSLTPAAGSTIQRCPNGLWTVDLASISAEQCLTPPGYYTNGTQTLACPNGYYRADWKPAADASSCRFCGEGVKTSKTDVVTAYNTTTNEPYQVAITTSSDDCYIMPGQGLYYTTLTQTWRARNCVANSYGVANVTYGLTPYACRECPTNMVTVHNSSYPTSYLYYINNGDGDGTEGFTDVLACVTIDGYGYNGRVAQPCDKGFWNSKDNYDACKACAYGLTTEGVGKGVSQASCGMAAGFGLVGGSVVPCPIGTYNALSWQASTTAACTNCSTGLTTAAEGSSQADQCALCVAGYGGANCASQCGGLGAAATYGPIGRSVDTDPACIPCSNQSTGYSFEWNKANDLFQALPLSKLGASSALDCVADLSQLMDGSWYIPIAVGDVNAEAAVTTTSFTACAQLCRDYRDSANKALCEFVVYDYVAATNNCQLRIGRTPIYVGAPLIGFKNLPSGDVGTNSWSLKEIAEKTARGLMVTTGTYTFYRDEQALIVGSQIDPVPAVTAAASATDADLNPKLQECLNRCDEMVDCAGITIKMNVLEQNRPTTCKLIKGERKLGVFKRTVIRADTSRMPLPSLRDLPDPPASG